VKSGFLPHGFMPLTMQDMGNEDFFPISIPTFPLLRVPD
jgi:hypothetical protein